MKRRVIFWIIFWTLLAFGLIFIGITLINTPRNPNLQRKINPEEWDRYNETSYYSLLGYYSRGSATIRISKIETFDQYLFITVHEWGHHLYRTRFTVDDLKSWKKAVEVCGYQSEYAKTFRAKGTKIEEEWADDVAFYFEKSKTFCPEKLEVLKKYASNR